MTLRGVHIDRLANGKIAERWESVDLLDVLRQLGATIASSPQQSRPPDAAARKPGAPWG